MFKAGKGLEYLANDAWISVKNWKKNILNDFIRKLHITEGSLPGLMERSLTTCWEHTSQDLIDQWLDRILLVIRATGHI